MLHLLRRRPPRLAVALLLLVGVLTAGEAGGSSVPERTAREALRAHGLPIGLLPRGVREFRMDEEGRFEAWLEGPCSTVFENRVHYEANVTGNLSYGQMVAVSGITAQELFLWFPVRGIRVDVPSSGLIYFDVGVVYKHLALSLFETPPDCAADHPAPSTSPLLQGKDTLFALDKLEFGKFLYELDQGDAQAIAVL